MSAMHTEEQARELWCPVSIIGTSLHVPRQGRSDKIVGVSSNRGTTMRQPYGREEGGRCIGSKCMMWRWQDNAFFDERRDFVVQDMAPHGVGHARGFCGLAGKPA